MIAPRCNLHCCWEGLHQRRRCPQNQVTMSKLPMLVAAKCVYLTIL